MGISALCGLRIRSAAAGANVVHAWSLGAMAAAAMVAGDRPLVASRTPDHAEIAPDEVAALLVPLRRAREAANAVYSLINDPMLANKLGTAARQIAEERFAADDDADRLQALYEQLP